MYTLFRTLCLRILKIEFVENHKHLGLTLSNTGKWNCHTDNIAKASSKILGIMRQLKYTLSRAALNPIYISYVLPVLEYSSVVWDGCSDCNTNTLEKNQHEAARIVTGLTRSVPIEKLFTECGWTTLTNRRIHKKWHLCIRYQTSWFHPISLI